VARNGRGVQAALVAWLVTVGIDLFFNAGLFSPLFDQDREPGLLSDEVLFRRVPFAYVVLLVGVGALTVILDLTAFRGVRSGALVGGLFGAVASLLGVIYVWTAIEMTGLFVAGGALVQVVEFAAAGAVIGAYKEAANRRRVTRWALITALMAAVLGIVIQNLLGTS
jgi:hypothetical protein